MIAADTTDPQQFLDALGRLGDDGLSGVLGVALAQWTARDDTKPEPEVRRAAKRWGVEIEEMDPHPDGCRP